MIKGKKLDIINTGVMLLFIYFFIFFCFSLFLQVFAYLGFVVAVLWIYSIANEIVNLLQVSYNIYLKKTKLYTFVQAQVRDNNNVCFCNIKTSA